MAVPKIKKVHFTTLGCSKNQVDTEVMARLVLDEGLELTANPEEADLIAVNTCAFLQASKEESVEKILELATFRAKGSCQKLVVTGCLPSRHPDEIKKSLPEVDHFLGTNDLHHLRELLRPTQKAPPLAIISKDDDATVPQEILRERYLDETPYTRYLKIAEGCDRACSFCIIPQIRGPQKSRTIDSLVDEAAGLVENGAKEINLIAQDLTAYGHDLRPAKRLEDLLEKLVAVKGLRWLRLHYAYPQRISERLIELLGGGAPLLPYLDMPIQHVNSQILSRMKRGLSGDKLCELLEKLRAKVPGLTLRTTVIVGFPGESDEAFQELLDFVQAFEFDHLGAFHYSREEGTGAHDLDGQLPEKVKKERYHRLMSTQLEVARKKNAKRIGQEVEVVVIGPSKESDLLLSARAQHQAADVDGLTYVTDLGPDPDRPLSPRPGDLARVRIEAAHAYDLAGSLISINS